MPEISVCIPSYNYADYVGGCIESVLRQDFSDFEVVIVDDASTDRSEQVIGGFRDPRIRYFRQPERVGLVGNWNACIGRASGRFLVVLHADDMLLPGMLQAERQLFQDHPGVGLVLAAARVIDEDGSLKRLARPWPNDCLMDGSAFFADLLRYNFVVMPTAMIRSECFERLGPFDARLAFTPDWEMWLRVALHYDVGYIARPLAAYREHEHNESRRFALQVNDLLEEERALRLVFDEIPESRARLRALQPGAMQGIAERAIARMVLLLRRGERDTALAYAGLAARLYAGPGRAEGAQSEFDTSWIAPVLIRIADSLLEENRRQREAPPHWVDTETARWRTLLYYSIVKFPLGYYGRRLGAAAAQLVRRAKRGRKRRHGLN